MSSKYVPTASRRSLLRFMCYYFNLRPGSGFSTTRTGCVCEWGGGLSYRAPPILTPSSPRAAQQNRVLCVMGGI